MQPHRSRFFILVMIAIAAGIYANRHPEVARRITNNLTRFAPPSGAVNTPVRNVANAPAVTGSWGTRIAAGHAFAKHGGEFGFSTRAEMAAHIDHVIARSSVRRLSGGRVAYWDDSSGTVVICDPHSADGGTAFKPGRGRRYFEGLR
jgi:hypothetical protein